MNAPQKICDNGLIGSKTLAFSAVISVDDTPILSGSPWAFDGFCQLPRQVSGKKSPTSARVEMSLMPQKIPTARTMNIANAHKGCLFPNPGFRLSTFLP